MSSPPSPTTSSTLPSTPYKGKLAHRSWALLPPEIIRWIATCYLLETQAVAYRPRQWKPDERWLQRGMYTSLRDALELEKLMMVCPPWERALETHLFWHHATTVIDPHDVLLQHAFIHPANNGSAAAVIIRVPPWRHFRNICRGSCIICRVNHPYSNLGLGTAKRNVQTSFLSIVSACRDHRKSTFCGVCLREAPPVESENEYGLVCCAENEDEDTWPGIEATCRTCRAEGLERRARASPREYEAIGGPLFQAPDWETRERIENFIELGEGSIMEVLITAIEKLWLKKNTKLADMLGQAVAASRLASREAGYVEESEEDEYSEEDDPELLSMTEDAGGVRELAMNDWARNRILDGHWISPADSWYRNTNGEYSTLVRAEHPCPWTLPSASPPSPGQPPSPSPSLHPKPETVLAEIPPTFGLCEAVYHAYNRQFRSILFPAMTNLVRRIVLECSDEGADPAIRASRMSMNEVMEALRDEGVWYNGIDWVERRRNRVKEERDRHRERKRRREEVEEDGSGASTGGSSGSDGSPHSSTSPVLSASTLGTTPSPPPVREGKGKGKAESGSAPAIPIPVSPILEHPTLLHTIPYVPITANHLPTFSMDTFKNTWREACIPLYQCRCRICERARLKANVEAGIVSSEQAEVQQQIQAKETEVREIRLEQAALEENVIGVRREEEEEEGEEEVASTDSVLEQEEDGKDASFALTPRKRPSREVEDLEEEISSLISDDEEYEVERFSVERRTPSPPKRVRTDGTYSPATVVLTPSGLKKRSSEELDDERGRPSSRSSGKRRRTAEDSAEEETATSPPTSRTTSTGDEGEEGDMYLPSTPTGGGRVPRSGVKVEGYTEDDAVSISSPVSGLVAPTVAARKVDTDT